MAGNRDSIKDCSHMRQMAVAFMGIVMMPSVANATTWYWISGHDNALFYADEDSVVTDGNLRKVWMQTFFDPPVQTATHVKELVQIDCSQRQMKFLDQRAYGKDGKILKSRTSSEFDAKRENIDPESTSEQLYVFACKGAKQVRGGLKLTRPVGDAAPLAFLIRPSVKDIYTAAVMTAFNTKGMEDDIDDFLRSVAPPSEWQRVRSLLGLPMHNHPSGSKPTR